MERVDSIGNRNYSNYTILHFSDRSIVCRATDNSNNQVILKSFDKSFSESTYTKDTETDKILPKELIYLKRLTGNTYVPNLLNYHDGENWSTVVIEYLSGDWKDLFDYIKEFNDEESIKTIVHNVIWVMNEMSVNGFYHRDIKPENIMVNITTLEVKLIDFEHMLYSEEEEPLSLTTSGTIGFKSPESFSKQPCLLKPSLVFSIGCLVYSCLKLERPFETENETLKCCPSKLRVSSKSAASFVSKCLKRNPKERIKFDHLIYDKWFEWN